jgi:hypothetical protein
LSRFFRRERATSAQNRILEKSTHTLKKLLCGAHQPTHPFFFLSASTFPFLFFRRRSEQRRIPWPSPPAWAQPDPPVQAWPARALAGATFPFFHPLLAQAHAGMQRCTISLHSDTPVSSAGLHGQGRRGADGRASSGERGRTSASNDSTSHGGPLVVDAPKQHGRRCQARLMTNVVDRKGSSGAYSIHLFIRMNRCKILYRLLSLLDESAFSNDKSRLIRFHVGA